MSDIHQHESGPKKNSQHLGIRYYYHHQHMYVFASITIPSQIGLSNATQKRFSPPDSSNAEISRYYPLVVRDGQG